MAAGALVLAACGGGGDGEGTGTGNGTEPAPGAETTITWWHNGTGEPLNGFWREVTDEFQDPNPGVTVEVQAFQNEELRNTILPNAFAGGNPPDIFQSWGGGELVSWVEEGRVKDITDSVSTAVEAIGTTAAGWQLDGRTYGLPYQFGPSGFWYNRDVLEGAGVDVDNLPTDLDEFYDLVDELKAADVVPVALGGGDGWPAAHYWYQFAVKSCAPEVLQEATATHDFSDPCWVEAGEYLSDFIAHEPFNNGWQTTSAQQGAGSSSGMVVTGQAAMELMGAWSPGVMGGILNDQTGEDATEPPDFLGWFPFPGVPGASGDPTAVLGGGDGFSVAADAPPEADALLEYILSPDVQERYAAFGNIPTVAGAEEALTYQPLVDNSLALQDAGFVQLWLDVAFGPEIATPMNNAIGAFMQGEGTPTDVVGALALEAGVDVELPTGDAYLAPLAERVRSGALAEAWVDRAVLRVLNQKEELGLLEPDAFADEPPTTIDLDTPQQRVTARRLAQESLVLLANDGVLPLAGPGAAAPAPRRVAVLGPNADSSEALMGCYSFVNHVLAHHPGTPQGIELPTVLASLRDALPEADVVHAAGCSVEGDDTSGFAEAVAAARDADVAIVVAGDQAGLFGRGTVGEGNDVESLELPGVQRRLVEEVVATGTPVVLVLLTGRPYAIGWALDDGEGPGVRSGADVGSTRPGDPVARPRPAAVVQGFFPGEEGGRAVADVLTGAVNPSGRLPVSLPRAGGAQPYSYLHPVLGGPSDVTSADPTPVRPFGFGLSYTSFAYGDLEVDPAVAAGGTFSAAVTVTNTGDTAGDDVVQLYARDVVGSVPRPVAQLLGYARVALEPGQSRRVHFRVPTTRLAFSDRRMVRVVEPGDVEVWVGAHAQAVAAVPGASDLGSTTNGAIVQESGPPERRAAPGAATAHATLEVAGPVYEVTGADPRLVEVEVE